MWLAKSLYIQGSRTAACDLTASSLATVPVRDTRKYLRLDVFLDIGPCLAMLRRLFRQQFSQIPRLHGGHDWETLDSVIVLDDFRKWKNDVSLSCLKSNLPLRGINREFGTHSRQWMRWPPPGTAESPWLGDRGSC